MNTIRVFCNQPDIERVIAFYAARGFERRSEFTAWRIELTRADLILILDISAATALQSAPSMI